MDLGLGGRVALVTGASAGLGRAIAAELAAEGARVAVASRSRARIDAAAAEVGAALALVWDTGDVEEVPEVVAEVEERLGPIDVLVTNTGGPPRGDDPLGLPRGAWEEAYRSLVTSPLELVGAVVPGMRERGFGRVVNVASSSVREPLDGLVLSSAHRASMVAAFKTIARDVGADGVTLNTVLPGRFATARLLEGGTEEELRAAAASEVPAGRLGEPEELAAAVCFLCSDRAGYVTGEVLAIDGGLTRSVF